jgi:hypothetical protein
MLTIATDDPGAGPREYALANDVHVNVQSSA